MHEMYTKDIKFVNEKKKQNSLYIPDYENHDQLVLPLPTVAIHQFCHSMKRTHDAIDVISMGS